MDVDYAMLQKIYGADPNPEKRYSPAKILSSTTELYKAALIRLCRNARATSTA